VSRARRQIVLSRAAPEGWKKADALAGIGKCVIALGGVWNWCHCDAQGHSGVPIDDDWQPILPSLDGRRVFICYDSDAVSNPSVGLAERRLANFLASMAHGCSSSACQVSLTAAKTAWTTSSSATAPLRSTSSSRPRSTPARRWGRCGPGCASSSTPKPSAQTSSPPSMYYRQRDVETAEALSRRTGPMLVHGRHNGASQGATASWSEGYAEREQPLMLPHEVLQLDAEHVVAFAGGTPPARLERIDWRRDRQLSDLVGQPAPAVPVIPEALLVDWPRPAQRVPSTATGRRSLDD
jgi:Domain of unknown function (DUF3854)/Type IV secretory system Conjugative DNA transfer